MSSYDQCMVSDNKAAVYLISDTNHRTCEACCDRVLSSSSTCEELMCDILHMLDKTSRGKCCTS